MARPNRPLKPWTKPWINKKLEDPKILTAVLAAIIIPTLILLVGLPTAGGRKKKPVEVAQNTTEPKPRKALPTVKKELHPLKRKAPTTKKKADQTPKTVEPEPRNEDPEPKKAEPEPKKVEPEPRRVDPEPGKEQAAPKQDEAAPRNEQPEPKKVEPSPRPAVELTRTRSNPLGMGFVLVEPGSFAMGSPEGTGDANEHPRHEVALTRPYYIGETEVTQSQYRSVTGENPSYFSSGKAGGSAVRGDGGDLPVESVSYDDALAFCKKLTEKEGLPEGSYRLPTEAEWEYAARGGSKASDEPQGDLPQSGWFEGNAGRHTNPVKRKKPNALGLYDTAGNVWEWCSDWFDESYYARSPRHNPNGPDGARETRVLRGGGWVANAQLCRPTDRNASDPAERINCYGFRVVLDPGVAFKK